MRISTCHNRCILVSLLWVYTVFMTGALAAETGKTSSPSAGNLYITSDKLVAEQGSAVAEFIGNVEATRNDAVLHADRVKVYMKPVKENPDKQAASDQGNVEKIVAIGHVEYSAGGRKALADQAVYTTEDEKLVLTGKEAKLLTGKSWVAGKKITLFRLEERVMVESDGKKRVQAFFDSRDQGLNNAKGDGTE